jgi:hypothetical protein
MQNEETLVEELETSEKTKGEEKPKSDKEIIDSLMANEEVRTKLLNIANQLSTVFRDRWFTSSMLAKKTIYKKVEEQTQIIQLLIFADLLGVKTNGNIQEYKICLKKSERAKIIQNEIDQYKYKIDLLEKEIVRLSE